MKLLLVSFALVWGLAGAAATASAGSFEDDSTPIEREDIRTIDQLNAGDAEGEPTPVEQEDIQTIDQLNGDDAEGEPTPVEQEDLRPIEPNY